MISENNSIMLPEIDYLFSNTILDVASFLCVLNCFRRKNIELNEFLFYYSLSVSYTDFKIENNCLQFGSKNAKYKADALNLYIKDHAQYIITYLGNNDLIYSAIDESKYPYNIVISISNKGKVCAQSFKNEYFSNLIQRTKQVIKSAKYTKYNQDKMFRGEYYDAYEDK